jgi:hypothetical protein
MTDKFKPLRDNQLGVKSDSAAKFDVSDLLLDPAYKRIFPGQKHDQVKASRKFADEPTASQRRQDGLTADEFQQLQRMESDVSTYGKQPTAELTQLIRDNQVVGIGDGHGPNEPQQINARDYLQALKNGGATHLVIEAPPSCKEMLDEFNRSGNLDESKLPILSQSSYFVAMLKAAHAAGLTVVAGDSEHGTNSDQPDRNPTMASTIENILNQPGQNPQHPNKVVFWVGQAHLRDYHKAQTSQYTTAAEILRSDHIKLATVAYQKSDSYSLAARAASVVSEPTMISTSKAKNFGEYADASYTTENSWDYVILYPNR